MCPGVIAGKWQTQDSPPGLPNCKSPALILHFLFLLIPPPMVQRTKFYLGFLLNSRAAISLVPSQILPLCLSLNCYFPQDSLLSPQCFLLYILSLGYFIRFLGFRYEIIISDDSQICISDPDCCPTAYGDLQLDVSEAL